MSKYAPTDYTPADHPLGMHGTIDVLMPNGFIKQIPKEVTANSAIVSYSRDHRTGKINYFINPSMTPDYVLYRDTCKQREEGHEWTVYRSWSDQIGQGRARPSQFPTEWLSDEAIRRRTEGFQNTEVVLPSAKPKKTKKSNKATETTEA